MGKRTHIWLGIVVLVSGIMFGLGQRNRVNPH